MQITVKTQHHFDFEDLKKNVFSTNILVQDSKLHHCICELLVKGSKMHVAHCLVILAGSM
jgi:hypothetical protein